MQGDDAFGYDSPYKEEYDDRYTTHYYRGTCLLMMPGISQDELLFESIMGDEIEIKKLLESFRESVRTSDSSELDLKLYESF